jgi:hypothetical protein
MNVKTEDENSNTVRKELVEEETELDDHALKVEKCVKTELNLKTYLQVYQCDLKRLSLFRDE